MKISLGSQAFLLELGTGKDGLDSFSAVELIENMGLEPEEVLKELSRKDLLVSVHKEANEENIHLSLAGKDYLRGIVEEIRDQYWYKS